MRVLITISDKYMHLLRGFVHLFNKYWGTNTKALICHYSDLPFTPTPNFETFKIGDQELYPFKKWSDGLIKVLESIDDEVFVLMLEDYWINRMVNAEMIMDLYAYMKSRDDLLKIDLMNDRLYAGGMRDYASLGYIDLIISDPNSAYHMSLMTGLWRRDNMLKVLIPNESAHEIETIGTTRVREQHSDLIVLGTRQAPLRHAVDIVRSLKVDEVNLKSLHKHDADEIKGLGFI